MTILSRNELGFVEEPTNECGGRERRERARWAQGRPVDSGPDNVGALGPF